MRTAHDTDFAVDVENIGTFIFGRRKMADEIRIQVEFARLTEGVTPTPWLELVAGWMSDLKILTVRAPDGWDVDEMDPLDDETYSKLLRVHAALREKENSFRGKPNPQSQAKREGEG